MLFSFPNAIGGYTKIPKMKRETSKCCIKGA